MADRTFVVTTHLPVSSEEAFAWHARPGALERLLPPWDRVEILEQTGGIAPGSRVLLRLRLGPATVRWVAVHGEVQPGRCFEDVQESGPFATWRHRHSFLPRGPQACVLEDRVDYALRFGPLGAALAAGAIERRLKRMFAYRHAVVAGDLERHRVSSGAPLRVAITGAGGLVGGALSAFLATGGHDVRRFVRRAAAGPAEISWDPAAGRLDPAALTGLDAVVHLAGESIAGARWNAAQKRRIRESRELGTRTIAEAVAVAPRGPRILVSASAIGLYGHRPGTEVDESSERGRGFLPDVVRDWESATHAATAAGVRVVHLRLGIVLAAAGGALAKMLTPFRLGAGGPVGTGRQGMSWVALDDVLGATLFALRHGALSGPVNVVAPGALPQREFARALGRVLRRPAIAPLPSPIVRALFGEMGRELLLEGAIVRPRRLTEAGFRFRFPELEPALRFELGRLTE